MPKLTSFLMSAALVAIAGSTHAMDLRQSGDTVTMSGPVAGKECTELQQLIAKGKVATVVLHDSHGGNAAAGYCVGSLIRKSGINTTIKGYCESSCSRMWLGGAHRELADADSWVGLHGNYSDAGDLQPGAPHRLRNWLPVMAPAIDEVLMEQWIHLEKNTQTMRFYREKAAICGGGYCRAIPDRTAANVGLLATELPDDKRQRLAPESYPRVGPVSALLSLDGFRDKDLIAAYQKFTGPKALVMSADGGRTTWRSDKGGLGASIVRALSDCQNAQIAASQFALRCYVVAIEDELTLGPEVVRTQALDPGT